MLSRGLDASFRIPFTKVRFGWDFLIGLIPGIGDMVTTAVSLYIVAEAQRLGISSWTMARMGFNILIDATIGALPVVGDIFDVFWKANQRNIRLLERALADPRRQKVDKLFGIAVLVGLFVFALGIIAGVSYVIMLLIRQITA